MQEDKRIITLNKGILIAALVAIIALALGLNSYFSFDSSQLQGMIKKSQQSVQEFDKQSS